METSDNKIQLRDTRIITSRYLTKIVKRSWKERLFTRPWNPFQKLKEIPDDICVIFDNGTICIHPAYEQKYREALEIINK